MNKFKLASLAFITALTLAGCTAEVSDDDIKTLQQDYKTYYDASFKKWSESEINIVERSFSTEEAWVGLDIFINDGEDVYVLSSFNSQLDSFKDSTEACNANLADEDYMIIAPYQNPIYDLVPFNKEGAFASIFHTSTALLDSGEPARFVEDGESLTVFVNNNEYSFVAFAKEGGVFTAYDLGSYEGNPKQGNIEDITVRIAGTALIEYDAILSGFPINIAKEQLMSLVNHFESNTEDVTQYYFLTESKKMFKPIFTEKGVESCELELSL